MHFYIINLIIVTATESQMPLLLWLSLNGYNVFGKKKKKKKPTTMNYATFYRHIVSCPQTKRQDSIIVSLVLLH